MAASRCGPTGGSATPASRPTCTPAPVSTRTSLARGTSTTDARTAPGGGVSRGGPGPSSQADAGLSGDNDLIYWLVAGGLILAVEINGLIGPGAPTQKPLTTVSGTIHGGLALWLVLYLVGAFLNS